MCVCWCECRVCFSQSHCNVFLFSFFVRMAWLTQRVSADVIVFVETDHFFCCWCFLGSLRVGWVSEWVSMGHRFLISASPSFCIHEKCNLRLLLTFFLLALLLLSLHMMKRMKTLIRWLCWGLLLSFSLFFFYVKGYKLMHMLFIFFIINFAFIFCSTHTHTRTPLFKFNLSFASNLFHLKSKCCIYFEQEPVYMIEVMSFIIHVSIIVLRFIIWF